MWVLCLCRRRQGSIGGKVMGHGQCHASDPCGLGPGHQRTEARGGPFHYPFVLRRLQPLLHKTKRRWLTDAQNEHNTHPVAPPPWCNPPPPPRFRGKKSTDSGSTFQPEVCWHKSGQVLHFGFKNSVLGPQHRPPTHVPFGYCVVRVMWNHNISVHF